MDWKTDIEPIVSSVVRHGLTMLAGALATAGAIQPDQQNQFIAITAGICLWGASQLWSAWQKRKQAAEIRSLQNGSK